MKWKEPVENLTLWVLLKKQVNMIFLIVQRKVRLDEEISVMTVEGQEEAERQGHTPQGNAVDMAESYGSRRDS